MEKSEYQGYWWLPDKAERKVPGTLKFDPDEGARLELLGSLKGVEDFGSMLDPELILGLSSKREPITLQDCGETKSNMTIGQGFATSSFNADTVFVGDHFQSPTEVGFERLFVEYLHLDAWAGVSGFELRIPDDHKTHPMMVTHTKPQPLTAAVRDEYEVTLSFTATRKSSSLPLTEVTITQRPVLSIKFPEKKSIDDLTDIAYRMQHLLSFGTRRSVHPVAVWGETGPVGETKLVAVNYRSIGRRGANKKRPMPHEMLFGLGDLPGGFETTVERWLERAEVLDPVYRLYLGTIYNPQSYIEQRFLNLVQALEVYHRRAIGTLDLPVDEHQRRKEQILEAVPNQHRDWLVGKLEYSNEPNLARRLKDIMRRYREIASSIAGASSKDRDKFLYEVVTTRNYHTHFDQSKEIEAARGEELYWITQELKLLIEICLLGEIGFEDERIRDLIK
jgi:hypothetical protein